MRVLLHRQMAESEQESNEQVICKAKALPKRKANGSAGNKDIRTTYGAFVW